MKRIGFLVAAAALLAAACGDGGSAVVERTDAPADMADAIDTQAVPDARSTPEVTSGPELTFDVGTQDAGPDVPFVECAPGEGCFLDPCTENADCQSGYCVEHMGDPVCTQTCSEECPPGWSCKALAEAEPDVVYICVSRYSNLCKPCATAADCLGAGGADDVCVRYGEEGSFCGGACAQDSDCPWGFSCQDVETVAGVSLKQCFADAGVCPCTGKSIQLGLWTPCAVSNEFGTCQGKRVCDADGLTTCDAAVPAEETCNGLDDDCDGEVDEPVSLGGKYVDLCNDDNACTEDVCLGADGCAHEVLTQGECVDGDACTVGDHCEEGVCVGLPVVCDDGNPCTDDLCDGQGGCLAEFNQADCDDDDPCTVADSCSEGECAGYAVDCECQSDADCAALEDGDLCNGTLYCDKAKLPYQCQVQPDTLVSCEDPEQENICTQTTCDPATGQCGQTAAHEGFACDDGDVCTLGDYCLDGACAAGVGVLGCEDANACTVDSCDPVAGCLHEPQPGPCNDGDACTTGDTCDDGVCVGGPPQDCDDQNPCTSDECTPQGGCKHTPQAADCDDGNACTLDDHCAGGLCVASQVQSCNDDDVCTNDNCDPVQGCVHSLNTAPCDDGSVCTTGDHCHLGECISSGALACDDGNECTDDSCNPETGCVYKPNAAGCDDGNACTTGDQCSAGKCLGNVVGCDDDNPCTDDFCDVAKGCIHVNNSDPCNDLDACTANEFCAKGACGGGVPIVCDDGNFCTNDGCDPETGCVYVDSAAPCDDGDACTDGDVCTGGACVPGAPLDCDDGNVCTDDSCDADSGCVHAPVVDETPCAPEQHCIAGECVVVCNYVPGNQAFGYAGSIANFTVPECVESLTIEVWGAQGGRNKYCSQHGGKGARMKGEFAVTPGETLQVVVGQRGLDWGYNGANQAGSGGGGSFVWRQQGTELLIAGGGGGGGAICDGGGNTNDAPGVDGTTSTSGTADKIGSHAGGTNGGDGTGGECRGKGWNNVQNNPAGYSGSKNGGYGGGGTVGNTHSGGGGGGYSGGGCTPYSPATGGGGGGSFNAGANQDNAGGVRTGDGQVIITW